MPKHERKYVTFFRDFKFTENYINHFKISTFKYSGKSNYILQRSINSISFESNLTVLANKVNLFNARCFEESYSSFDIDFPEPVNNFFDSNTNIGNIFGLFEVAIKLKSGVLITDQEAIDIYLTKKYLLIESLKIISKVSISCSNFFNIIRCFFTIHRFTYHCVPNLPRNNSS